MKRAANDPWAEGQTKPTQTKSVRRRDRSTMAKEKEKNVSCEFPG
jgi:hypothetical protein